MINLKKIKDFLTNKKSKDSEKVEKGDENPYLNARREWNENTRSLIKTNQTWQFIAIASFLIALVAVGGIVSIGSKSKFVPYVVEVNKLGEANAIGTVESSSISDPQTIKLITKATVSQFIEDSRMVSPDIALQRKAIFRIYSHLEPSQPATNKMNEWFNGTENSSPFKKAETEMINVNIITVLPQTKDTWQVDWNETIRDRQGVMKGDPIRMRALVTVYKAKVTSDTSEEQMRNNPLGLYVRDFSWSRLQ